MSAGSEGEAGVNRVAVGSERGTPRAGQPVLSGAGTVHYLSEHLPAAVALPGRWVGNNPGDLRGGVRVLVGLLLSLFPPRLAAASAHRRLAALGGSATASRRVGDGPQQLHHRTSQPLPLPAPCCPLRSPPQPAPDALPTPGRRPVRPLYPGRRPRLAAPPRTPLRPQRDRPDRPPAAGTGRDRRRPSTEPPSPLLSPLLPSPPFPSSPLPSSPARPGPFRGRRPSVRLSVRLRGCRGGRQGGVYMYIFVSSPPVPEQRRRSTEPGTMLRPKLASRLPAPPSPPFARGAPAATPPGAQSCLTARGSDSRLSRFVSEDTRVFKQHKCTSKGSGGFAMRGSS